MPPLFSNLSLISSGVLPLSLKIDCSIQCIAPIISTVGFMQRAISIIFMIMEST